MAVLGLGMTPACTRPTLAVPVVLGAGGSAGGHGALGDPGTYLCPHSVEGGELFERIIDDDYHLTEVDCMVFVRQICEGIRFMHHMRVLHLDLKVSSLEAFGENGAQRIWAALTRSTAVPWVWVTCPHRPLLTTCPCPHSPRTSSASLPLGTW